MIKFFRKIRQNLLSEGKTGKYLKYAIGEIILVVIGILIALGINNWNTNKINTSKQRDYLSNIKSDLEKQIPILNRLKERTDSTIFVGNKILTDYHSNQDFSLITNLNQKMTQFFYTVKFPDISSTFNELNSTGQISLIKNKSLRTEIISYYQNSKDSQEDIRFVTSHIVYSHIYQSLKSSTVVLAENFGLKNDIVEIPNKIHSTLTTKLTDSDTSFELYNAINFRIISANANRRVLLASINEAEQLLDKIENELKK